MATMKIEALYTYPIKALRAQSLDTAQATKHGFPYDRRFMLLEPKEDQETKSTTYRNMHVAHDPAGTLFFPTIHLPSKPDANDGKIVVCFKPPKDSGKKEESLTIPLKPDITDLEQIPVTMHNSPTQAYRMPAQYNDWFTSCFGHPVILAYLGTNYRAVLMSAQGQKVEPPTNKSWLTSLTSTATSILPTSLTNPPQHQDRRITFSDCAPYLITSQTSLTPLSSRLPADTQADMTKFRPNIVVSGAAEPWEEDFWAKLAVRPSFSSSSSSNPTTADTTALTFTCDHNCARCKSVNIDYSTGKAGTGGGGRLLASMQRDRRVDEGVKWSPVFGRYCFLGGDGDGGKLSVGDEVVVLERNGERTRFDWKGLASSN